MELCRVYPNVGGTGIVLILKRHARRRLIPAEVRVFA